MGLMPIIFTALGIFVISAAVFLLVSYLLYKLRPKKKPYIEISPIKPSVETKKPYYTVPVYEQPVRKPVHKLVSETRVNYRDINRYEVLNVQKPRYMQTSEARTYKPAIEGISQNNIYEYYSNSYNERGFRAVTL